MSASGIVTFIAVGLASPVLGWIASLLIQATRARRAYKRLRDDPLVFRDSTFNRCVGPSGNVIMQAGRIAQLSRRRILLETTPPGERIPMTILEFEPCHCAWTTSDEQIKAAGKRGQF